MWLCTQTSTQQRQLRAVTSGQALYASNWCHFSLGYVLVHQLFLSHRHKHTLSPLWSMCDRANPAVQRLCPKRHPIYSVLHTVKSSAKYTRVYGANLKVDKQLSDVATMCLMNFIPFHWSCSSHYYEPSSPNKVPPATCDTHTHIYTYTLPLPTNIQTHTSLKPASGW